MAKGSCAGSAAPPYPEVFVHGAHSLLVAPRSTSGVVTLDDLAGLPVAAQRYLQFAGVLGRPRVRSLRARFVGRFRRRPGGAWTRCEAWQYSTADPVARLFRMRLTRPGLPAMTGWGTYDNGHGRLRAALLGVIPVAHGSGPRFDASEQVTWLDDALLLAPSMLLRPAVAWSDGPHPDTFRVSLTDAGRTVDAEVLIAADGAPRDVRTDDRWAELPGGAQRVRWSTPVDSWRLVGGRPRITEAHAVWDLPGEPFCYVELTPTDVAFDVTPEGRPLEQSSHTEDEATPTDHLRSRTG